MITVNVESEFEPNRLKRAVAHLETALRADSGNVRYRRILAEAYLAARRFEDALSHLEQVWQQKPEPRAAYLLAYASFRLGRLRQAADFVEQAAHPDTVGFARLHILRGRIAMERGLYADAVNDFSRAMILKPESDVARWHMGRALIMHATVDRDDAGALFRRALHLLKDLTVPEGQADEWHELLGRTYLALHHPVEALRHLERSQRPASAEKSMLLGFAYLLHGHHDKALPFLRTAAVNQEVRPRLYSYLEEVAMTPRPLLSRMGLKTGPEDIPLFLDHQFLGEIFGPGAQEVAALIQAATRPRSDLMDRTQAEVRPETRVHGRLLASGQSLEKSTAPHGNPAEHAAEEPAKTSAPPDEMPRSRGDRLFPQTLLEVPQEDIPAPEEAPPTGDDISPLSDEDWDIGIDDAFGFGEADDSVPSTEQLEIPDTDEGEDEDEEKHPS